MYLCLCKTIYISSLYIHGESIFINKAPLRDLNIHPSNPTYSTTSVFKTNSKAALFSGAPTWLEGSLLHIQEWVDETLLGKWSGDKHFNWTSQKRYLGSLFWAGGALCPWCGWLFYRLPPHCQKVSQLQGNSLWRAFKLLPSSYFDIRLSVMFGFYSAPPSNGTLSIYLIMLVFVLRITLTLSICCLQESPLMPQHNQAIL